MSAIGLVVALSREPNAAAQLFAVKSARIVYSHHHLNVTSVEAHRKFWVTVLGGSPVKLGPAEVIKLPNVFVFLNQQRPTGGTKGTTVNHLGFEVPSVGAMVDRLKAAEYPIVTRAELPPRFDVKDGLAFIADINTYIAFVMGPDDTKVEFVENKSMTGPIALHHIHYAAPKVDEMKAWYADVLGATPGKRGPFEAADLPGVNLTFSPAADPVVSTRGRVLDHLGFEVRGLQEFCTQLEARGVKLDRKFAKVPELGIANAFLTDPWGTYIELTEGLDRVQ